MGLFHERLKKNAIEYPDKLALIDGETVLTYSQLMEQSGRFARGLSSLHLTPTSKLGVLCLNQQENLIGLLGGFLSGVPVVPINPLLLPEDLEFVVKDARLDVLLINGMFVKSEILGFIQLFKKVIVTSPCLFTLKNPNMESFEKFMNESPPFDKGWEREKGTPDVLLYTSGTTALPKGVPLSEEQFYINTGVFLDHLKLTPDDRCIVALPMFHSFGNIMVLTILRIGGTLIFLQQFQPKTILAKIEEHKATVLPLVPTIYAFLVELIERGGFDVSSLRLCISGGASLPESLLKKVELTFDVTVLEGYGLTETSPVISVNKISDGSIPGSVGPVLSNLDLKIVNEAGEILTKGEVGEILVKGPTVMNGYWNRPEETKQAFTKEGWFRTGDLGHLDEKNRLYISAGRIKDLIIRAGENISPLAIENVLMNHPDVREVAAVGSPHPSIGEKIKLCLVRKEGVSISEANIRKFCRNNLPAFMKPDIIQFYDELPKTPTGKVLKSELRKN